MFLNSGVLGSLGLASLVEGSGSLGFHGGVLVSATSGSAKKKLELAGDSADWGSSVEAHQENSQQEVLRIEAFMSTTPVTGPQTYGNSWAALTVAVAVAVAAVVVVVVVVVVAFVG